MTEILLIITVVTFFIGFIPAIVGTKANSMDLYVKCEKLFFTGVVISIVLMCATIVTMLLSAL